MEPLAASYIGTAPYGCLRRPVNCAQPASFRLSSTLRRWCAREAGFSAVLASRAPTLPPVRIAAGGGDVRASGTGRFGENLIIGSVKQIRALSVCAFTDITWAAMSKEDNYRQSAADAMGLANRAASTSDKSRLLGLAERWLDLADRAHRRFRGRSLVSNKRDEDDRPDAD
jgi:hypothetical protein